MAIAVSPLRVKQKILCFFGYTVRCRPYQILAALLLVVFSSTGRAQEISSQEAQTSKVDGSSVTAASSEHERNSVVTENPDRWYRAPLALAYVASPVLAVGVTSAAINAHAGATAVLVTGGLGLLATPVAVHGAHGNGLGALRSAFGTLGLTAAGTLVGLAVIAARVGAPDCTNSDGGDLCGMGYGIEMLALGAVAGYVTWGIIDTTLNAHVPQPHTASVSSRTFASVVPTIAPLFAYASSGKPVALDGLTIGAAATF